MDNSTIDEVKASLKQAGYTYDENMSVDNNVGSAMLGEYAEGYKDGYSDKCEHIKSTIIGGSANILCSLCWDNGCQHCPIIEYCKKHEGMFCPDIWKQYMEERIEDYLEN